MNCNLCPRRCNVERIDRLGFCDMPDEVYVSKMMVHMWEEPVISGENGSGAIFFSGCNLKCVYCQNKDISHGGIGKKMSVEELAKAMLDLQSKNVHNINLVTPTHYSDKIISALKLIRDTLHIPVVYNTSGYELPEVIESLYGYVDIFLTDMKYISPEISKKYSMCPDYYEYAKKSFAKMLKICPQVVIEDGIMKKGVIMRHLVLPSHRNESIKLLEDIANSFDISKFRLSLMSQYTPDFCDDGYKELKRKITSFEYQSVVDYAIACGYDGYIQEKSSANKKYTPNFKE